MTLYDFINGATVQGDICIAIFDPDGHETTRRYFRYVDDLAYEGGIGDIEFSKILFVYVTRDLERDWLIIEVEKEEEDD